MLLLRDVIKTLLHDIGFYNLTSALYNRVCGRPQGHQIAELPLIAATFRASIDGEINKNCQTGPYLFSRCGPTIPVTVAAAKLPTPLVMAKPYSFDAMVDVACLYFELCNAKNNTFLVRAFVESIMWYSEMVHLR